MSDVIVIGGGLAGLAASVALAQSGVQVTLLESRPRLGGRASSFEDAATGELIDNCQHVAMGCCTNFRHFCRVTGLASFFRVEEQLTFVGPPDPSGRQPPKFCQFSATPFVPAPLHLGTALWRLSYLSWRDKLAIARGLFSLRRPLRPEDQGTSFAAWLAEQRQPTSAIELFWNVVLVSALSESLHRISVAAARKVFVDGFLTHRDGWKVSLPTVPLDELYSGTLARWLAEHGVDVRLKTGVERLVQETGAIAAVELRNGERLTAGHFVLAVPQQRALALLPESLRTQPSLAAIERLEAAPIASVHLWFDRPITLLPHAVLVGRLSQWVFRKVLSAQCQVQRPTIAVPEHLALGTSHYYQVVISNAREVAERPAAEVVAQVVAELKAVWPWAADAELKHSRVIVEHQAVFSPLPGSDELRPLQQSPITNLQLAGDWTRTGWPATMEGAVRSGFLAAENVLAQLGRPATWLQSDLAQGGRKLFAR
jgi:squalene-associated FAD-dependent desaturase